MTPGSRDLSLGLEAVTHENISIDGHPVRIQRLDVGVLPI